MDSMLDVSDNIISDEKYKDKIFSIKANGNTKQICLWSINLENSNFTEL